MVVRNWVCAVVLIGLFAPLVYAQEQGGGDLTNLSLEQLMQLQVVTASKHAQDASDTPASVTVITRADIRAFGYRTLAEVLQGVRGFWVTSDRNYSYIGVRGFSRPGDYNSRVLLLVNGHRLNDNVYDESLIGTEFPLDLDLVERIEIVRGPGSSLYGTNAFFAVINVITARPETAPTIDLSADVGTNYMRKGRVTANLPHVLDGALVSVSSYRSNGIADLYFPEFDAPETNNGIAHRVDGDRYDSAFALVNWRHFEFQALLGSRGKFVPTASFGTIFDDRANHTTDTRGFGELKYERALASQTHLVSRWYYDMSSYSGRYAYDDNGSRLLNYDSSRGDWLGTELTISRPIRERNTITGGAEFRYNLRQYQRNQWEADTVPVLDDHRSSNLFAVYAQDELKVVSQLTFNLGLRVDQYSTFGTAVSPRAAAIYRPDRKTAIKYTFGNAFRAPNSYESYYADFVSQEANPDLKPENIGSHSVAVERVLTPALQITLEAFYNHLKDLIDQQIDPATEMYRYVNVNRCTGKGVEFDLNVQHKGFRGELSYTLQRSIDGQTRAVLANSPQHLAKLKVQAPVFPHFVGAVEVLYRSPQLTFVNVRIPDSLVADFTVSSRKPLLGFQYSFSVYNLFDRRNYDPITPALDEMRLLQNGRELRFKISRNVSLARPPKQ